MKKNQPRFRNHFSQSRRRLCVVVVVSVAVMAAHTLTTSKAHAQRCVATKDLLESLSEDLKLRGRPCDAIGWAFSLGLSGQGRLVIARHPDLSDEHLYYVYVRFYLADEVEDGGAAWDRQLFLKSYPFLVAAREMLPNFDDASLRKIAYEVFPAFAFGQYGSVDGTSQSLLIGVVLDAFQDTELDSGRKLHCFIRLDIPTIDERKIIQSKAYQDCIIDK